MEYGVLDVCRHIITYSDKMDYGVSNLKLQKLLYFIQAAFLLKKDRRCFVERIEAWDFGPIVPEAYEEYGMYGAGNIPSAAAGGQDEGSTLECAITEEDMGLIHDVVDMFKDFSGSDITSLSQQQAPWMSAYRPRHVEITADSIRGYFSLAALEALDESDMA